MVFKFGSSLSVRMELDAGFRLRKRRSADLDAQHAAEPQVLAHALMHHLFVHAPSARVALFGPHRKVLVPEFTPDAQDLHPLGIVGVDKKVVRQDNTSPGVLPVGPKPLAYGTFVGSACDLRAESAPSCSANLTVYSPTRLPRSLPTSLSDR